MGSYKSAGVDITAGYKSVELMKQFVNATKTEGVVTDIGGFGGLFSLVSFIKDMSEPILVSGTDGVGTKLKIAFLMDKHDTIGIDCVAMCVNDIICCGAKPLFLLDYIACGKVIPEKIAEIVKGVSLGARMANAALIGGETAEMPGFYSDNEYDIAGFSVGIVDKCKIIDGSTIACGDVVIGIASSGIHSNGYSLVRSALSLSSDNIGCYIDELGAAYGEVLLTPTEIYVDAVLALGSIPKGIANITGGGFFENIPRVLPKGLAAKINLGSWDVLPIFDVIKFLGKVDTLEMFNTFNMGIGMVLIVASKDVDAALSSLSAFNKKAFVIGEVTLGEGVFLC